MAGDFETNPRPRSDARIIAKALREKWPISAETRQQLVSRLVEAALAKPSARNLAAAVRVVTAADRLNFDIEQVEKAEREAAQKAAAAETEMMPVVEYVARATQPNPESLEQTVATDQPPAEDKSGTEYDEFPDGFHMPDDPEEPGP